MQRACKNFSALARHQPTTIGPLTSEERKKALLTATNMDQSQNMPKELKNAPESISDGMPIKDGTVFYDKKSRILRYFGRVRSDNLTYDEQYPIILPPRGSLAKLLLRKAHEQTLHGGAQQLLQQLRQTFWVPIARRLAKSVINKCTKCFRYRLKSLEPHLQNHSPAVELITWDQLE